MIRATRPNRLVRALGAQATAFTVRVVPDLLDKSLVSFDAELNHHIDEQIEQLLDIGTRQLLSRAALLYEQHQLLKGEFGARGVYARNRAWMPAVDVSQVIEGFFRAKLCQEDAIRLHAKTGFQELFRRHAREALIV